jgi:LysM repeat protein
VPGRHCKTSALRKTVNRLIAPAILATTMAAFAFGGGHSTSPTHKQPSTIVTTADTYPEPPRPDVVSGIKIPNHYPYWYRVRPGNTLSAIATEQYGYAADWTFIYFANKNALKSNPNLILVGQDLKIPDPIGRPPIYTPPPPPAPAHTVAASEPSDPSTSSYVAPSGSSFEQCVIRAESGGDSTAYNDSSGASGLFGFLLSTWLDPNIPGLLAVTSRYPGGASTAPASVQYEAFNIVYASQGTGPWAAYDGC